MAKRTQTEWLALIQDFESSGLQQTVFCRQHGINPKYFSQRKCQLKKVIDPMPFVAARREAPKTATPVAKAMINLSYRGAKVTIADGSAQWLAQLLNGLHP